MDEASFKQYGSRCAMWIPPEEADPIVKHEPVRKKIGYFGAVRLRDGKFVSIREEGSFNGETFFNFMKLLYKKSKYKGKKIVVILDNVRYHHAVLHKEWRKKVKSAFILFFLPPYSPELNPIERVWKLSRRNCTHNKHFPSMDKLVETVEKQFTKWGRGNKVLKKLCAIH